MNIKDKVKALIQRYIMGKILDYAVIILISVTALVLSYYRVKIRIAEDIMRSGMIRAYPFKSSLWDFAVHFYVKGPPYSLSIYVLENVAIFLCSFAVILTVGCTILASGILLKRWHGKRKIEGLVPYDYSKPLKTKPFKIKLRVLAYLIIFAIILAPLLHAHLDIAFLQPIIQKEIESSGPGLKANIGFSTSVSVKIERANSNSTIYNASGTIYIRADGSVDPPSAPISSVDNVTYTLTDNINDSIVVERDNIVVDGAGYTVQGTGSGTGINLTVRSNVTIKNMEIKVFEYGIWLGYSSNNNISGNIITNNWYGVWLSYSSNNSIFGNNITNPGYGIRLWLSSNNVLRSNSMANNVSNFDVWGWRIEHFTNDVDVSNTIDGKPIYYWISKRDRAVPLDAGYVALVNCTRVTVQNLNLTNNEQGVLLAFTTNSTVTKNNVMNNRDGVWLVYSSNNNIYGNNIRANYWHGIWLYYSSKNSLYGNNITNNCDGVWLDNSSNNNSISGNKIKASDYDGMWLYNSSSNSIHGNNITANNRYGIRLWLSSNNRFYHNNFINNTQQFFIYESYNNTWDNGYPSGGNYWSDYNGTDTNQDGIGDTPYVIDENNRDNYPLMGMFYDFSFWDGITAICNSTISDFQWGYILNITTGTWKKAIEFNVFGPKDTVGFCRIMIPRAFMEGPYTVLVNNEEVNATELPISNSTHAFLYFTYNHSARIRIIPEFPSALILPLLLIITLVAVILRRRRFGSAHP